MSRLVLQMQMTVDGFVSSTADDVDWQLWKWADPWPWDDQLRHDFNATLSSVSTILLSRPMAEEGYIDHWTTVADRAAHEPDYAFADVIRRAEKVVLTSSDHIDPRWPRTRVLTGPVPIRVGEALAGATGDVVAFGGVRFARTLLTADAVDEVQLYINPAVIGEGVQLFSRSLGQRLHLLGSTSYSCGMVVSRYAPASRSRAGR